MWGLGAALGACLRYWVTVFGKKHWESAGRHFVNLPLATLLVNLLGALMIGFIFALNAKNIVYSFWATGVLGGLTTFSTLNTELIGLLHEGNYRIFLLYLIFSYGGGLLLVYSGYLLGLLF